MTYKQDATTLQAKTGSLDKDSKDRLMMVARRRQESWNVITTDPYLYYTHMLLFCWYIFWYIILSWGAFY